jgi:hypothetical protein
MEEATRTFKGMIADGTLFPWLTHQVALAWTQLRERLNSVAARERIGERAGLFVGFCIMAWLFEGCTETGT